jgi:iron-sulfur cluster repair protein YtfE (RIC family)
MPIPGSLIKEHRELHSTLEHATGEPGELGNAARALAERLMPHFEREEEFALPPLGLLAVRGEGDASEVEAIIAQTDRLADEIPSMLKEHTEIGEAALTLSRVARGAGKDEYVKFTESLMDHAKMEEEIMYPAALLVGAYLRARRAEKRVRA